MTESELREYMHKMTEATYRVAIKKFDRFFLRPTISFKLTGLSAGIFEYRYSLLQQKLTSTRLRYNLEFCMVNQDEVVDTIIHEVAHHIAIALHGNGIRSHGYQWKSVYKALGGTHEKHTYSKKCNKPESYYRKRPYIYTCGCREFRITKTIHNKMRHGQIRSCPLCGKALKFDSTEYRPVVKRAAKTLATSEKPSLQKLLSPRNKNAPVQDANTTIERLGAKEKGYTWYWTGRPCKHGHVSSRNTANGICRECWNTLKHDKSQMDKEL